MCIRDRINTGVRQMSKATKKAKKKIEHWKVIMLLLIAYDFLAILLSYFAALWLRFDCNFNEIELAYLRCV